VIFIKNKYIILVVLVILIIVGAGIVVSCYKIQNNQQNDTTTINNNNTNEDMNLNITNNNTNNNINSKNADKYQKPKPKPQQTTEPILISKKQAINKVKGFLESDESSDVVSNHAKLIKVGKKHYWVIKKYDYELYIDAKTGKSVNPQLVLYYN
jgi:cytoskeletal protein RodZ